MDYSSSAGVYFGNQAAFDGASGAHASGASGHLPSLTVSLEPGPVAANCHSRPVSASYFPYLSTSSTADYATAAYSSVSSVAAASSPYGFRSFASPTQTASVPVAPFTACSYRSSDPLQAFFNPGEHEHNSIHPVSIGQAIANMIPKMTFDRHNRI